MIRMESTTKTYNPNKKLESAILKAGYNISSFAHFAGIPPSNLYNVLNGKRKIINLNVNTGARIANALKISINELIFLGK